jgi:phosphoglycolate phosphatase-like HAD superfamily hydrolase
MKSLGILIFDMDGTLIDSMEYHSKVFSIILNDKFNIPISYSNNKYYETSGEPLDHQFRYVIKSYLHIIVPDVNDLINLFFDNVSKAKPILFNDVRNAIKILWNAGYILVVISGCTTDVVVNKMQKTEIASYFKLLLGTDYNIPGMTKGEGHFNIIRKELGFDCAKFRQNSALIGDGKHDMLIAKQAGIVGIGRINKGGGVVLKKEDADLLITTLDQLINKLKNDLVNSTKFIPINKLRERLGGYN